jgi:transposase-like protein
MNIVNNTSLLKTSCHFTDLVMFFKKTDCIFNHYISQTAETSNNQNQNNSDELNHTAKDRFNEKHNNLNLEYYKQLTLTLLQTFYPKTCPSCGCKEYKTISKRETSVICTQCKTHFSLTAYTPAHHFKMPLWTLGYIIKEAIDLYPQPLTGEHIKRKLRVGSTACFFIR